MGAAPRVGDDAVSSRPYAGNSEYPTVLIHVAAIFRVIAWVVKIRSVRTISRKDSGTADGLLVSLMGKVVSIAPSFGITRRRFVGRCSPHSWLCSQRRVEMFWKTLSASSDAAGCM